MSRHTATRRRELLTRRALVVVEDVVHIIEVVFVRHDVFLHAKASLAARRRGRKWCVASEGEGDETTELSMRVVFRAWHHAHEDHYHIDVPSLETCVALGRDAARTLTQTQRNKKGEKRARRCVSVWLPTL